MKTNCHGIKMQGSEVTPTMPPQEQSCMPNFGVIKLVFICSSYCSETFFFPPSKMLLTHGTEENFNQAASCVLNLTSDVDMTTQQIVVNCSFGIFVAIKT